MSDGNCVRVCQLQFLYPISPSNKGNKEEQVGALSFQLQPVIRTRARVIIE